MEARLWELGVVENKICLDDVDSRSSRGREYLVFLIALPALFLRTSRNTRKIRAMTTTTAMMAAMTPPAMAPPLAPSSPPDDLSVVLPAEIRGTSHYFCHYNYFFARNCGLLSLSTVVLSI